MARTSKPENEKVVSLPASVLPAERTEVLDFAQAKRWSVAKAVGYLTMIGLQYERQQAETQAHPQAQAQAKAKAA
jgi:hypothetical protein